MDKALSFIHDPEIEEWRIHFHVPIFIKEFEFFGSTQAETKSVLEYFKAHPFSPHLEVETYTWDVLPENLKTDLFHLIERELEWALENIA